MVLALCAGGGVARAAAPPGRAARPVALPSVVCHVTYGGETQDFHARPSATPYTVATQAIGSYFLFRLVLDAPPGVAATLRVSTFADQDGGPVPIHVAEYPWPPRGPDAASGFTGLQRVYEPLRDGELEYWCARRAAP